MNSLDLGTAERDAHGWLHGLKLFEAIVDGHA